MHANIVGAHERGLQNEEEQPSSENNGVKIKDKRARRGVDAIARNLRRWLTCAAGFVLSSVFCMTQIFEIVWDA